MLFWSVVAPLFVACVPGAVLVVFVVLKADELLGNFLVGQARQENEIFLATLLIVWAFSTTSSYHLMRIDRLALRLLAAAACGLVAASVAEGILLWVKIGLGGRLLMLSAQVLLGLLLLRAGRHATGA